MSRPASTTGDIATSAVTPPTSTLILLLVWSYFTCKKEIYSILRLIYKSLVLSTFKGMLKKLKEQLTTSKYFASLRRCLIPRKPRLLYLLTLSHYLVTVYVAKLTQYLDNKTTINHFIRTRSNPAADANALTCPCQNDKGMMVLLTSDDDTIKFRFPVPKKGTTQDKHSEKYTPIHRF